MIYFKTLRDRMQSTSQTVFGDKVVKKRKRMKAEARNIILVCKFSKSHAAGKTPLLIFQSETFLKDCKQLILGWQMVLILSLDQRKSERHLVGSRDKPISDISQKKLSNSQSLTVSCPQSVPGALDVGVEVLLGGLAGTCSVAGVIVAEYVAVDSRNKMHEVSGKTVVIGSRADTGNM